MEFTKMHGAGNDFIIIDNLNGKIHLNRQEVEALCHRHFGIGSDGLIIVEKTKEKLFFMNYYNCDGTIAEICGNGVRCTAKYIVDAGYHKLNENFIVRTRAGDVSTHVISTKGNIAKVSVNMGKVIFDADKIPLRTTKKRITNEMMVLNGQNYQFGCASMGNPHMVVLVSNLSPDLVEELGPILENSPLFPNKCNVNFVQIINRNYVLADTWERGSGRTLACGSGSCAVASILKEIGLVDSKIKIKLSGGELEIDVQDEVTMTGPATTVFEGDFSEGHIHSAVNNIFSLSKTKGDCNE